MLNRLNEATMRRMSYAVLWNEAGQLCVGRLELSGRDLLLDGTGDAGARWRRRFSRAGLRAVRIARDAPSRLDGRPVIAFESGTHSVRLACLDGIGALHELVEELRPPH